MQDRRLFDVDEEMVDGFGQPVDQGDLGSDEVYSASVPSFADGLPQGQPSYQRHEHHDVD